jgi:hypothetical protein
MKLFMPFGDSVPVKMFRPNICSSPSLLESYENLAEFSAGFLRQNRGKKAPSLIKQNVASSYAFLFNEPGTVHQVSRANVYAVLLA